MRNVSERSQLLNTIADTHVNGRVPVHGDLDEEDDTLRIVDREAVRMADTRKATCSVYARESSTSSRSCKARQAVVSWPINRRQTEQADERKAEAQLLVGVPLCELNLAVRSRLLEPSLMSGSLLGKGAFFVAAVDGGLSSGSLRFHGGNKLW